MTDTLFTHRPNLSPMPGDERAAVLENPGFGRVFTDHMLVMRYRRDAGWHGGTIEARAPFQIDPACVVLHYAQEVFEGMKAYRTQDGGAALFRPDANAARFRGSAERMAMPPVPDAVFVDAVRTFVSVEQAWIPGFEGGSLYIRPFMFASDVFLGVRPSAEYRFVIIGSPAGHYFGKDAPAITLWTAQDYIRAAPGGTGAAKCGGNYAGGLVAQTEAINRGCDQVLFLDAVERRWVEELGGMNVFFVFADGSVGTPPLEGTILPGITRDSLLVLAREMGFTVREERYALEQWRADAESGVLTEAFACGTAAVVTPIGRVRGEDFDFSIGGGVPGKVTGSLREALVGLQHGRVPDRHGWFDPLA